MQSSSRGERERYLDYGKVVLGWVRLQRQGMLGADHREGSQGVCSSCSRRLEPMITLEDGGDGRRRGRRLTGRNLVLHQLHLDDIQHYVFDRERGGR